jgi:integrase
MVSDAYNNFVRALENKSLATRQTYLDSFKSFLIFFNGSANGIVTTEPKSLQHKIRDFLDALKAQGRSYSTINKAYWAVRTFLAANEVIVNWDWIDIYKPKKEEKEPEDRPYSVDEISSILAEADIRAKTAVLMMVSGGFRKGALPLIRLEDLTWIENPGLYAVHVYPGTDSHYYGFVTPQCSQFIDTYKDNRTEGFLFVNKRDYESPVTEDALMIEIYEAMKKAALRKPTVRLERKEVQMMHGFRKFYRTQLDNSMVAEDMAERLMGHGNKLVKTYAIPQIFQWLETSQYAKAIDNLTI